MNRPTCLLLVALAVPVLACRAEPIRPQRDDEIVERLPGGPEAAADRRLRRQGAAHATDPAAAVALARRHLERAREQGDPREAGLGLAALAAWPDDKTAPDAVLLMRATLEQHLHAFDDAAGRLERLVQRSPRDAQAWLTLATVRRVQGRLADAARACERLAAAGAALPAMACRAEQAALRGDVDGARRTLQQLLAVPRQPAAQRAWLLVTCAEIETREGRRDAAEAAWRAAVDARAGGYAALAYADFLLAHGRPQAARAALRDEPATDAVLLRRAIAARRAGDADAAPQAAELRERFAAAAQRPDVRETHGRELAMAALWLDDEAARAVDHARANLRRQREPADLLLLAQAARSAGDAAALREAAHLREEMKLHDRRLDALL